MNRGVPAPAPAPASPADADAGSDSQLERALAVAYQQLGRRERTVQELRGHLLARALTAPAVEAAIGELTELGYLDDARYAQLFAQDKRTLEQWGAERIRRELIARGIPRDLAHAASEEGEQDEGELERALAVLARRFPDGVRDARERERALGMLLRKGYEYELANDALSQARNG